MVGVLGVNPISKNNVKVQMPNVVPGMRVRAPFVETVYTKVDKSEEVAKLKEELKTVEQIITEFRKRWDEGLEQGSAGEYPRFGFSIMYTPEGKEFYATETMQNINSALRERLTRKNAILRAIESYENFHVKTEVTRTCESVVTSISPEVIGREIR